MDTKKSLKWGGKQTRRRGQKKRECKIFGRKNFQNCTPKISHQSHKNYHKSLREKIRPSNFSGLFLFNQ